MPPRPRAASSSVSWMRRTVEIECNDGRHRVIALCLGTLAVYPGSALKNHSLWDRWLVGHAPTGLLVGSVLTEEDAKRMALELWRLWGSSLRETEKESAADIPEEGKAWVRRCQESGRYEPFNQE